MLSALERMSIKKSYKDWFGKKFSAEFGSSNCPTRSISLKNEICAVKLELFQKAQVVFEE